MIADWCNQAISHVHFNSRNWVEDKALKYGDVLCRAGRLAGLLVN